VSTLCWFVRETAAGSLPRRYEPCQVGRREELFDTFALVRLSSGELPDLDQKVEDVKEIVRRQEFGKFFAEILIGATVPDRLPIQRVDELRVPAGGEFQEKRLRRLRRPSRSR